MFYYLILILICFYTSIKLFCVLTMGRCKSNVCLVGKTALITGSSSGIGLEAAMALASRGCRVIVADIIDPEKAKQMIIKETNSTNIVAKTVDFQSFKSVRKLAKDIIETEDRLDILVNNAGIGSKEMIVTEDGLSRTLQVNFFSHFLLTYLLIDLLKKSAPSRIIFTSSSAAYFIKNLSIDKLTNVNKNINEWKFDVGAYGDSKVLQAIGAIAFADKLQGTGVTSNAFHPGGVNSEIFNKAFQEERNYYIKLLGLFTVLFGKTTEEGAQTLIHLACEKNLENKTGKFFLDCTQFFKPKLIRNVEFCRQVFRACEKIVKIGDHEKI